MWGNVRRAAWQQLHCRSLGSTGQLPVVLKPSTSAGLCRWKVNGTREIREMAEAIRRNSLVQSLLLKSNSCQQWASSSCIQPRGTDSINQPGEPEKTTWGRGLLVVRNLTLLFIEISCLGVTNSGTPPQAATGCRTTTIFCYVGYCTSWKVPACQQINLTWMHKNQEMVSCAHLLLSDSFILLPLLALRHLSFIFLDEHVHKFCVKEFYILIINV